MSFSSARWLNLHSGKFQKSTKQFVTQNADDTFNRIWYYFHAVDQFSFTAELKKHTHDDEIKVQHAGRNLFKNNFIFLYTYGRLTFQ